MNKKGFTLVELLAVIAIIAILTIVVTPGIFAIRASVLKNSLDSKITSIHTAALEYAEERIQQVPSSVSNWPPSNRSTSYYFDGTTADHDCFKVTVAKLISSGYLPVTNSHTTTDGQGNGQILNPITNESLNNQTVCVRYDSKDALSRKLVSYIFYECDLYDNASDAAECLKCSNGAEYGAIAGFPDKEHWKCK